MRTMKMMLVASLMTAACGEVAAPNADDGMGSDSMGSDQGSGSDGGGMGSGSGVMGALTFDDSPFVNDGTTLWSDTDHPILKGLYLGSASATINIVIGNNAPIIAQTQNNTNWSIQLSAGSISSTPTPVKVTLSDASSNVEVTRQLAVDAIAPRITLAASHVHDERSDSIAFGTGEPVHTHSGPSTDLGASGCPAVYKYAYLMSSAAPLFGSETTKNPLAWQLNIADTKLDASYTSYRVRNATSTVADWAKVADPNNPIVLLTSDSVPQLTSYVGDFFIDVRARDWTGLETTQSWCFENHPLAPPVEKKPIMKELLFSESLVSDTQLSPLLNTQMALVAQRIVAYGGERQTLTWTMPSPTIHYTKVAVDDIVGAVSAQPVGCPQGQTDPKCTYQAAPTDHADSSASGVIADFLLQIYVWDQATGQPVTFSVRPSMTVTWDVPARAADEAPHAYNVVVYASAPNELRPPKINVYSTYGEYSIDDGGGPKVFTGEQLLDTNVSSCEALGQTVGGTTCLRTIHYWRMSAVDHITLAFDDFDSMLETQTPTIAKAAVAYAGIPAGTGPLNWDSGDDDLPGIH